MAAISDIEADRIRALARGMASEPCLLSISWSLQRTENGDQPYWMIAVLGAMLGNLGLPGQGVGYGYGCIHNFGFAGRRSLPFKVGALPQGDNPVRTFIPGARIADGDIVRVFNDRGATLAGAVVTDRVRGGVVVLPTGAWYDPADPAEPGSLDVHGNPNVLTRDVGTSTLAQGTSAHSCLVEVERYEGPPPDVKVFRQPPMTPTTDWS